MSNAINSREKTLKNGMNRCIPLKEVLEKDIVKVHNISGQSNIDAEGRIKMKRMRNE